MAEPQKFGAKSAGFFVLDPAAAKAAGLLGGAPVAGRTVAVLDGAAARTKADFMQEAMSKLDFPDYFGRNWDAFQDSFNERLGEESLEEKQFVVVFTDADDVLSDAPTDDLTALLEVLKASMDWLAGLDRKLTFAVVFVADKPAGNRLAPIIAKVESEPSIYTR